MFLQTKYLRAIDSRAQYFQPAALSNLRNLNTHNLFKQPYAMREERDQKEVSAIEARHRLSIVVIV